MKRMILYMIRHGESESNAGHFHSGWSCVHLTEKGRKQAAETGKLIKHIQIDELYVSDVLRTQETAEIIFPGRERTFMPLARELDTTPMKGKTKRQMTEIFGEKYLSCREKFDYSPLGIDCESLHHLSMRADQLLRWAQNHEDKQICIVSHAGMIKAVASRVLGMEIDLFAFSCDNASLSAFEFSNGTWKLKKWNITPMDQGNL